MAFHSETTTPARRRQRCLRLAIAAAIGVVAGATLFATRAEGRVRR